MGRRRGSTDGAPRKRRAMTEEEKARRARQKQAIMDAERLRQQQQAQAARASFIESISGG